MKIWLGTYFKIPLYLHVTWLIFAAILFVINPNHIVTTLMAYFFVILHEYGHCLAAKSLNLRVKNVTIYPLGGLASIHFDPSNAKEEFLVTIAGPAVNVLLVLLSVPLLFLFPYVENEIFRQGVILTIAINFIIAAFNIVPVLPMDGGRIMRSILNVATGDYVGATFVSVRISQLLAVMLIVVCLYIGMWMAAAIFAIMILLSGHEIDQAMKFQAVMNVRSKVALALNRPELLTAPLAELVIALENLEDEEIRQELLVDQLLPLLKDLQGLNHPTIYNP